MREEFAVRIDMVVPLGKGVTVLKCDGQNLSSTTSIAQFSEVWQYERFDEVVNCSDSEL